MPTLHIPPQGGKLLVWKQGESGNPNGRPKGKKSIKYILDDFMALEHPNSQEICAALQIPYRKLSWKEVLACRALDSAFKGSLDAFKTLIERTDGKPKEISDDDEKTEEIPIKLTPQQLASLSNELIKIKESLKQPEQKKAEVIEVEPINPCKFE